jgi:hypothetical protein
VKRLLPDRRLVGAEIQVGKKEDMKRNLAQLEIADRLMP